MKHRNSTAKNKKASRLETFNLNKTVDINFRAFNIIPACGLKHSCNNRIKTRDMKRIVTFIICCMALAAQAQYADTASRLAASYFKEAEIAARHQHIWRVPVYGPMMFVDPETRITYANQPDSAGILKPKGDIYEGHLPKSVMIANTAIDWGGKTWSVMLWPMLKDRNERVNLMMHESFHRIQARLGLPEHSPTVDHLGTMYGRIYFLLELKALEGALEKPVAERSADLKNALVFRERRKELFPETFPDERVLEMSEGLAEYTGVILGRKRADILPHLCAQIDTAGERKSLIRSCAYITGSVYGYLLYQKSPSWTMRVDSNSDFPALIAQYYHIALPQQAPDSLLAALEQQYGGAAIIASEKQKEAKRLALFNSYVQRFTKEPVLTIRLQKMGISFNPNTLFDLAQYGTVYPTAEVKDVWGTLTVTSGGMLMKDWQVITLPAGDGLTQNGDTIEGTGWKIQLKNHWRLAKKDAGHYELVKEE